MITKRISSASWLCAAEVGCWSSGHPVPPHGDKYLQLGVMVQRLTGRAWDLAAGLLALRKGQANHISLAVFL